jgi:mannose-6-phosphate isomerase-like protein (cupin superfamily)
VNSATGERIVFRQLAEAGSDDPLRFDLFVAPGGRVGGFPHKHEAEEHFALRRGALHSIVGLRRRVLGEGDTLRIPPRVSHFVWNGGREEAHAEVEARPGDGLEHFFAAVFELGSRRPRLGGMLPPARGAALFREYGMYGPVLPVGLQRPLIGAVAALRRGSAREAPE